MRKSKYDDIFKEEILNECREVGNASIVARRHNISRDTVYGWVKASKKRGSVVPLPIGCERDPEEYGVIANTGGTIINMDN
jgi:transposase-like protein